MKLWVQDIRHSNEETPRIIPRLFKDAGITVVRYQHLADYGLMWNIFGATTEDPTTLNFSNYPIPLDHVVMCYDEPPFWYHMKNYHACDDCLAWFGLPKMGNHGLITMDPIVFPYPPYTKYDKQREDTRIRDRKVFYRGARRNKVWDGGEEYGRIDLSLTRSVLVQDLLDAGISMDLMGSGWTENNTYWVGNRMGGGGDWPNSKRREVAASDADFHLCCENCRLDNYISEKIHHGFWSDLVVLYLGNPKIDEYVPREAFINLNNYYDISTGRVDSAAVVDRIRTITQDEYDSILHAARAWRKYARLEERHEAGRLRLTQLVLDRFREAGAL